MTLTEIRDQLLKIASYVANSTFLSLIGWQREGMGNVLVNKRFGDKMVCVVVGQVVDERLYCGPMGNLLEGNTFNKAMDGTKFSFLLGRPIHPGFAEDFDQVVRTVRNWEGSVAMTDDRRYFIEVVGHESLLCFTAACWEKRDVPLKPGVDTVDTDTAGWPVPATRQAAFNITKLTHRIMPLAVYDHDKLFVDCTRANAVLRDAVVEVHFTVKHYAIRRDGGFDSFSGFIQQVVVLQPAGKRPQNPYRLNLRSGPTNVPSFTTGPPPSTTPPPLDPPIATPILPASAAPVANPPGNAPLSPDIVARDATLRDTPLPPRVVPGTGEGPVPIVGNPMLDAADKATVASAPRATDEQQTDHPGEPPAIAGPSTHPTALDAPIPSPDMPPKPVAVDKGKRSAEGIHGPAPKRAREAKTRAAA